MVSTLSFLGDLDLDVLRYQRLLVAEVPRTLIARHVLAITATFANYPDVAEAALAETRSTAQALERQVRTYGNEAETRTLDRRLLMPVLDREGLYDDYQRIRAVEQHLAFDEQFTDDEITDRSAHLYAQAKEARISAEWCAIYKREQAQLCICGHTRREHRQRSSGSRFSPDSGDTCRLFTQLAEERVMRVTNAKLEAALQVDAAVPLSPLQLQAHVTLIRSAQSNKTASMTVAEALTLARTALTDTDDSRAP